MSKLKDSEICKRIAEIEYGQTNCRPVTSRDGNVYIDNPITVVRNEYNPLTDDALCFRLMVKYKIDFCNYIDDVYAGISFMNEFQNRSPNRAICLAIIAANEVE